MSKLIVVSDADATEKAWITFNNTDNMDGKKWNDRINSTGFDKYELQLDINKGSYKFKYVLSSPSPANPNLLVINTLLLLKNDPVLKKDIVIAYSQLDSEISFDYINKLTILIKEDIVESSGSLSHLAIADHLKRNPEKTPNKFSHDKYAKAVESGKIFYNIETDTVNKIGKPNELEFERNRLTKKHNSKVGKSTLFQDVNYSSVMGLYQPHFDVEVDRLNQLNLGHTFTKKELIKNITPCFDANLGLLFISYVSYDDKLMLIIHGDEISKTSIYYEIKNNYLVWDRYTRVYRYYDNLIIQQLNVSSCFMIDLANVDLSQQKIDDWEFRYGQVNVIPVADNEFLYLTSFSDLTGLFWIDDRFISINGREVLFKNSEVKRVRPDDILLDDLIDDYDQVDKYDGINLIKKNMHVVAKIITRLKKWEEWYKVDWLDIVDNGVFAKIGDLLYLFKYNYWSKFPVIRIEFPTDALALSTWNDWIVIYKENTTEFYNTETGLTRTYSGKLYVQRGYLFYFEETTGDIKYVYIDNI